MEGFFEQIVSILLVFSGLLLALRRRILQISLIGFFVFIGSIITNNNFKIYLTLICLLLGIFITDFITKNFLKNKKNKFFKFLY